MEPIIQMTNAIEKRFYVVGVACHWSSASPRMDLWDVDHFRRVHFFEKVEMCIAEWIWDNLVMDVMWHVAGTHTHTDGSIVTTIRFARLHSHGSAFVRSSM